MRERLEQILKIICCVLALILLVQLIRGARQINPLAGAAMPALPSLPADTNEVARAAMPKPPKMGTNAPGTNAIHKHVSGTNAPGANAPELMAQGTNALNASDSDTNVPVTNASTTNAAGTNELAIVKAKEESSNAEPVEAIASSGTNHSETNVSISVATGTNADVAKAATDTNISIGSSNKIGGTNLVMAKKSRSKNPGPGFPSMMMAGLGGPGGKKPPTLAPDIQARVNRVTESEIFGPVIHPMPMALLGIAGNVAFLRSPSGQTGLVKEGDELGDIKLLRIGVNRVLIEQDGEKKELTIFSGFGGESLLPKTTESSDETTKK